jgi:diguanylate cyclase (GGDEF)-like protein
MMREDAPLMSQPAPPRGPRWFPRPLDLLADPAGLTAFVDQAFDGLCTYAEGAIRQPTARMAELLAAGEDDLEGASLLDLVSPDYRDRVARALARRSGSFEVELMRHDGARVAVSLLIWHPAAASGDLRLIGLRRIDEAAPPTPATLVAAGAASRWQVALEQLDGCSLTVDPSGFVLDCLLPREHPAAWTAEDALGRPIEELLPPALVATATELMSQVRDTGRPARGMARLRRGTDVVGYEVMAAHRAGEASGGTSLLIVERPLPTANLGVDEQRSLNESHRDERRTLRRELAEARHRVATMSRDLVDMRGSDRATGLPNARSIDEALRREFRAAIRAGTSIALMVIEIDSFARFDDQGGAEERDDVLRAVATAIRAQLRRPRDVAGCVGGAVFMAVLAETDEMAARARSEAVRASVQALELADGTSLGLTVSVGAAATHPNRRSFLRDLEEGARAHLVMARSEGGNVVCSVNLPAPWDNSALF